MDTDTVVLITGANTGLGYQMVRSLCASAHPYRIFLGGRSIEKANKARDDVLAEFKSTRSGVHSLQIDIDSDESIKAAFATVERDFGRLDVLVNNAGAQFDQQFADGKLSMRQMWTESWTVNVVGTQIMTHTFIPLLLQSKNPRVLFVASGTSSLGNAENPALPINRVPAKGWPKTGPAVSNVPAYRSAKCGMNMMMKQWHRNLTEDCVKVWCISPGYLATGLGGSQEANKTHGAGDPAVAGTFVRDVIEGKRDADVGKVITRDSVQPW